ncbi:MAG: family 10 glycosylhydrolase [Elusimicrobiota bacterium]
MKAHTVLLFSSMLLFMSGIGYCEDKGGNAVIGLIISEANGVKYKRPTGIYQKYLRDFMDAKGVKYDIVNDAKLADVAALKKYACIIGYMQYLYPEKADINLAKYVEDGGKLLWLDAPAYYPKDWVLFKVLGMIPPSRTMYGKKMEVNIVKPEHPSINGVTKFVTEIGGNCMRSVEDNKNVVLSAKLIEPATEQNVVPEIPLIIANNYGLGEIVYFNFNTFSGDYLYDENKSMRTIIENTLIWLFPSEAFELKDVAFELPVITGKINRYFYVSLPKTTEKVEVECTFTKFEVNGSTVPEVQTSRQSTGLNAPGKMTYVTIAVPENIIDGTYELNIKVMSDNNAVLTEQKCGLVELYYKDYKKSIDLKSRAKRLKDKFTGRLTLYDLQLRDAQNQVPPEKLVESLVELGVKDYEFLVWRSTTDYQKLVEFVPLAQKKGIDVWITLVPPSESPPAARFFSEPFRLNYLSWAHNIAVLSKTYSNVAGLCIDDFPNVNNLGLFKPAYIEKMTDIMRSINPDLVFLPILYYPITKTKPGFIKQDYNDYVDGTMFAYIDLEKTDEMEKQITDIRKFAGEDKIVAVNVYAAPTSWHKSPPSPEYLKDAVKLAKKYGDIVRLYCPPGDKINPLYTAMKEIVMSEYPVTENKLDFIGAYLQLMSMVDKTESKGREDIQKLLDKAKDARIMCFAPLTVYSNHTVLYDSKIVKKHAVEGWDPLKVFIEEAHKRGQMVYPWVCCLVAGSEDEPAKDGVLVDNPDWAVVRKSTSGYKNIAWFSPSNEDAKKYLVSLWSEVAANYDIDGIILDYMRFPNKHDTDFRKPFVDGFCAKYGVTADTINVRSPEWLQYKRDAVTVIMKAAVDEIRRVKPGKPIMFYTWGAHTLERKFPTAQPWDTWVRDGLVDSVNVSGYVYRKVYGDAYMSEYISRFTKMNSIIAENNPKVQGSTALGVYTSHGKLDSAAEVCEYIDVARQYGVSNIFLFTLNSMEKFGYLDEVIKNKLFSPLLR